MRRRDAGGNALVVPEKALIQVQGTYSLAVVGAGQQGAAAHASRSARAPGTQRIVNGGRRTRATTSWSRACRRSRDGAVVPRRCAARERAAASAPPPGATGQDRGGADVMSAFFIRRPIVAMVIAILTVLIGAVSLLGLPIAQFPQIIPPQINLDDHVHRRRRADHRAVGGDADRAADQRRRQHALHPVDQRQRRHDEPGRDVRRRHQHRHRQRAGQQPLLAGAAVPARRT